MKVKYLYSGNVYQDETEIEKINSPLEGELYVPNFETKKYFREKSLKKALKKEFLKFLRKNKKKHGIYNYDIILIKYKNGGYSFGERIQSSFSY